MSLCSHGHLSSSPLTSGLCSNTTSSTKPSSLTVLSETPLFSLSFSPHNTSASFFLGNTHFKLTLYHMLVGRTVSQQQPQFHENQNCLSCMYATISHIPLAVWTHCGNAKKYLLNCINYCLLNTYYEPNTLGSTSGKIILLNPTKHYLTGPYSHPSYFPN